MRWDESPRLLMIASVASAVVSAAVGLAAQWGHGGYNVGAALLALLSALLGYRTWEMSTHRRLDGLQRAQLLLRLSELPPPADLRIVAVPDDEAVTFARHLRDVFVEAGWPARGVYHAANGNAGSTGLFLAVQDGDDPPGEAYHLLVALSEFGLHVVKSTKRALPDHRALELLVGRRP
jgi:hypothetical protein